MKADLKRLQLVRRHVLGILNGLEDDDLRRRALPSGWSALGLVRHLTIDVEQFWFQAVLAGQPAAIAGVGADNSEAWDLPAGAPAVDILDAYRAAAQASDAIIAATDPGTPPRWWPTDLFGSCGVHDADEVVFHVIVESAYHAGHLDAARELMDGRQWMVLT